MSNTAAMHAKDLLGSDADKATETMRNMRRIDLGRELPQLANQAEENMQPTQTSVKSEFMLPPK